MNSPRRIPAAIGIGFVVCLLILYADLPFNHWCYWPNDLRYYLLATPKGKLWALLVCVQATTWFVALLELGRPKELGTSWTERWSVLRSNAWVIPVILLCLLALPVDHVFFHPDHKTGLAHANHHFKVLALASIALLAILLVATEMFRIRREFGLLGTQARCNPSELTRFVDLREGMSRLLLLMGAMFSALAVGTGAFRNSWNAIPPAAWQVFAGVTEPGKQGEIEDVLGYCAIYSLPIFLIYAPAYAAYVRSGRRLVDQSIPADESSPAAWLKSAGERAALEKSLQLDTSMADRLKDAMILLSPVLTGAVSLLLPTKQP